MKRIILLCLATFLYSENITAEITAMTKKSTIIYRDYEQKQKLGSINKGEIVEIIQKEKAHRDDNNYWRFDLQLNNSSIRIKYNHVSGYVNFLDLESLTGTNTQRLKRFSDKVLVPVYYCDSLYHLNIEEIKKVDPFILKYDDGIKYFFIDDRHQEWYYNYPINHSFCNDLYFQITSKPGRYSFSAFIISANDSSLECIIDTNFDQFYLLEGLTEYFEGRKYKIDYYLDGDYITLNEGHNEIFKGVFVDKETWEYIYYFITKREDKVKYRDFFSKPNMTKIRWPKHSNGSSDYL